jgi:hypothetical protein
LHDILNGAGQFQWPVVTGERRQLGQVCERGRAQPLGSGALIQVRALRCAFLTKPRDSRREYAQDSDYDAGPDLVTVCRLDGTKRRGKRGDADENHLLTPVTVLRAQGIEIVLPEYRGDNLVNGDEVGRQRWVPLDPIRRDEHWLRRPEPEPGPPAEQRNRHINHPRRVAAQNFHLIIE